MNWRIDKLIQTFEGQILVMGVIQTTDYWKQINPALNIKDADGVFY